MFSKKRRFVCSPRLTDPSFPLPFHFDLSLLTFSFRSATVSRNPSNLNCFHSCAFSIHFTRKKFADVVFIGGREKRRKGGPSFPRTFSPPENFNNRPNEICFAGISHSRVDSPLIGNFTSIRGASRTKIFVKKKRIVFEDFSCDRTDLLTM